MKKKLSFVLALLILSTSVISCSDKSVNNEDTSVSNPHSITDENTINNEESEKEIIDDLPEINFGDSDFMIYNTNSSANTWYLTTYVDFEEDSADVLESAIYHRNAIVEDRFGIVIKENYSTRDDLTTHLTAGGDGVDMLLINAPSAFMTKHLLYDLNTLDNIDLDKPYWDQNARVDNSLTGKYFAGIGDFMTTHIDVTACIFFNKSIVTDYNLESPYELIDNYKWTYDKMYEMGKKVISDSDGNGVYNDLDRYALLSHSGMIYPFLIFGSGETYVTKDENDIPYVSYNTEKFVNVFEKILSIVHSEGDTFTYDARVSPSTMGLGDRIQEVMFPNNQALFWIECVSWSKALRDMEADFGIITSPMYNEEQGQYYNFVDGNIYCECIPTTLVGENLNRATIIVEALNSSSSGVVDAYYDISLKGKHYRDEESGRMLDLIFANRIYDISVLFNVSAVTTVLEKMGVDNDTDLASCYKRNNKVAIKLIENIVDNIK